MMNNDRQNSSDIVASFAAVKVLIVGDLMLDQYWWGTVDRISPEAPVPVVRLDQVTLAAGGAANVAANVSGLGAEPLLIGMVGKDGDSQLLIDHLASRNIAADHLARSERPTSIKTRIVAHSQHVVRVDRESSSQLTADEEAAIIDSIEQAISRADIVVLSDYAKGTLTDRVLRSTIDSAAKRGIPVLVDPKGKDFSKYRGASILTPNRREALEACRMDGIEPDATAIAGSRLIDDLDLESLVITEGERGMTLFEKDKTPVNLKAAAHEIYDVTGAGDTVIACLAVAIAAGMSRLDAVDLANMAAGIVVEQVGTTAISIESLVQKLDSRLSADAKVDAALL
jgi:D-beta-D-heptose 7-phosphate kinase/D-beta-D-heptose 1-phosphate adenosyltransferase